MIEEVNVVQNKLTSSINESIDQNFLLLKNKLASSINKSNCYNINVPNESKSSELVLITRYRTKVD